ncbi:MAG TPA: two-component system response regulator [Spirochaeta sp.]|nr:two-component system response regulator [Spirochaeta sp.]
MKNEKILVVEDERIIAIDLQRRLERFGYTVVGIAAAGDQAIELVKQYSPDIILMDIMLVGDIDGIETATIIKNEFAIPVIFLTAYSDDKTLERAKIAEPSGYILKPFKDKELYTTIDISLYKYRVDQELKRQQRWSTAILHSIGDGIIATSTDEKIILLNPIAEKITGWTEEEALGRYIADIIELEDMSESGHSKMALPGAETSIARKRPFTFKNCYLANRLGEKLQVEGSLASITDKTGVFEGLVLAIRDMTTVKKLSEAVAYHTSHDKLTGLSNRENFSIELERLHGIEPDNGSVYSLVYIDIDRFKIINDTCGHTIADTMLVDIAAIIKELLTDTNHSARLGGDQFGLILRTETEKEAIKTVQNLHKTFHNKKLQWNGKVFAFDTSIGMTFINDSSDNVSEVLAQADDACLLAKEEGGNRIKVYDRKENQFLQRRGEMEWVSKLSKALEENRFELYIQEIRPLSGDSVNFSKGEILIRMKDEEGNTVMPADFIPAAERYNIMPQIDKWVITQTIELYLKNMQNGRFSNIKELSVNLSAQSMSDDSVLDFIKDEFARTGISPSTICFEITETATISNMSSAHEFIDDLKQTGCSFALDDFGSGFSSFNYLKNLPVDYLKIDGIFVRNMHEDDENRAMVEAINNMGQIMGKKTIAEFVCNAKIIEMLSAIGVDFAQGYEIAIPVPLAGD